MKKNITNLNKILRKGNKIKYYNNLNSDLSYEELPIINKRIVLNNYDSFLTSNFIENCYYLKTSGTTCEPLTVIWKDSDYIKSNYYIWNLRKKWYNINPTDKMCTFHVYYGNSLINNKIYRKDNVLSLKRGYFDQETLKNYIDEIISFSPKWIQGPVSIVLLICEYVKNKNLKFDFLKYIELNGEFVYKENITYIKNVLNVEVSNLYGAIEFNSIAFTCPKGHMHIIEKNVFVESQKNNELLVSTLTNSLMPLIKYQIGDKGIILENPNCKYSDSKILILEEARVNEIIRINDIHIDLRALYEIIEFISLDVPSVVIHKFFIRKITNDIFVMIVIPKEFITVLQNRVNYYERKINLRSAIQLIIKFITVDDVNLDKKIKFFEEVK